MKRNRGLYAALSVFLVYHLFCVIIAPNSSSYFGRRFEGVISPYVSFFELASQWGFFAPDPGPPPVFVEYEVVGGGGDLLATGSWPEPGNPYALRERQNRRIGVARFMIGSDIRIEKMMGPYVCGLYPRAKSVRLWRVVRGMANLYDVVEGKRRIDDGIGSERKIVTTHLCGEAGGAT